MLSTAAFLAAVCLAAAQGGAEKGLSYPAETYRLENGLLVTLHPDHSLPQVVIDTWYWVGSKDEAPGRTGFAHLFEHLMFMGTQRVPGNAFDVLMESGGGSNNASTSEDRTNYYSEGPSGLLGTLLWLDADRLEALGANMTEEKLDSQREVVRNERRQTSENTPYGKAELLLPELLYPESHPYHHSVIGSHEDLEAATLADVVAFFDTHYTTTNASLVVAGDFEPAEAKRLIQSTFGQVARRPPPAHRSAPPVSLAHEVREVAFDRVQFPKLMLAWHSPAYFAPGDGELDLFGAVLSEGPSSRLVQKLVHEEKLAQEVRAYQASAELGSTFNIEALAAPGVDLELLKTRILAVLAEVVAQGPSAEELARVKAAAEASFLQGMESLFARADRMNTYVRHYGVADGFQRDLDRWKQASPADVQAWSRRVLVPEHVDLRILPEGAPVPEAWRAPAAPVAAGPSLLDQRPAAGSRSSFDAPRTVELALKNGIKVLCLPRPGTGLFAGAVYGESGPGVLPSDKAGLAVLAASMLGSGAAGKSAAEFAGAVEALGAGIDARAGRYGFRVSVEGLSSRLAETLDRFADAVLRPNLTAADFAREKTLLAAEVAARPDDPRQVAGLVARALACGSGHPSGVALEGYGPTVAAIEHKDLAPALTALLHGGNATFVFAGDFEPAVLLEQLEARFGGWPAARDAGGAPAAPVSAPPPGRLVLVDRPAAAQTMIYLMRPMPPPKDDVARAVEACVETLFGRSFTSRLNQNLRELHNYTYGAGCRLSEEGDQHLLLANAAVHTPVTGAALLEFRREFDALATGNVTAEELSKARETVRAGLVASLETTGGTSQELLAAHANHRPADAVARDLAALEKVDLPAVNAFVRQGFFAWKDLQVVLVGDRALILPQLEAAGFGAPLAADADGRLAN
jgi:zinc protease